MGKEICGQECIYYDMGEYFCSICALNPDIAKGNCSNDTRLISSLYYQRKKPKIYVASSWRNDFQPEIVNKLRESGCDVYDFKNPGPNKHGFSWSDIDTNWENWDIHTFMNSLNHPIAQEGFENDMRALKECDVCVLLLPSGRSAHIEAGYAAGCPDKKLCILMPKEIGRTEPELMYNMADYVTDDVNNVIRYIKSIKK